MYFDDLPDCKKCCLCLPLRHGIVIFGNLNLGFSLYVIGLQIWFGAHYIDADGTFAFLYRGVGMATQVWFYYLLYGMEVIFNIVLLAGAYMKEPRLIRVYYNYAITTTVAAFLTFIVLRPYSRFHDRYFDPFIICSAFCGLVLQAYLLLIIRSELKKLQFLGGHFHYVNHLAEVVMEPLPVREDQNPL